jgi:hypothetical protein
VPEWCSSRQRRRPQAARTKKKGAGVNTAQGIYFQFKWQPTYIILGVQPTIHIVLYIQRELLSLLLGAHVGLVEEVCSCSTEVHLASGKTAAGQAIGRYGTIITHAYNFQR